MGVKATVAGMTLQANHVAAAEAAGNNASALQTMAKMKCDEAVVALRALLASMQAGDPNITTVQNQITALS